MRAGRVEGHENERARDGRRVTDQDRGIETHIDLPVAGTLLHEIAHVLLHPKRSTFIDGFKADDNADAQETAANTFAEDQLIPSAYRAQLAATTTVKGIVALANVLGVSPSLVAGQWAFMTNTWGGPIGKLRKKFDLAELLAQPTRSLNEQVEVGSRKVTLAKHSSKH